MSIEIHPFEPFIPEEATKLIIGTIPPERFSKNNLFESDVNFYYGSKDNAFWNLLSEISHTDFLKKNSSDEIDKRKQFLTDHKIGICDIVKKTLRKNGSSLDKDLDVIEFLDIVDILKKYPTIDSLIYTSGNGGVKFFMTKYLRDKFSKEICHRTINSKQKKYFIEINSKNYQVDILFSPSPNALRSLWKDGATKRVNKWKEIFA
ncbi:hypothetical protein CRU94_08215 [Arcobacter sp. AHV-9/2010]|uniref:uracil-DNA glycosylase family protein n=1 Tax=Arcobacter sp. AHV-9/2010 TaxID=2021861 RepID=UPI00100AC040|nr:uracil-DNA glycosylase family protein [Arcobacter sp. CECT 9299]RXJ94740.1 hypothetical protein CRU94_08215 [Arcobacter sp. CECT 9299]